MGSGVNGFTRKEILTSGTIRHLMLAHNVRSKLEHGVPATLSAFDLYLFAEGTHNRASDKLVAHLMEQGGRRGVHFPAWAPNARSGFPAAT
jgi:hypothetical protein